MRRTRRETTRAAAIAIAAAGLALSAACSSGGAGGGGRQVNGCRIRARTSCPHADLQRAHLRGAQLGGAKLRGARLDRADLRGAKLARADLQRVSLTAADLRGADLTGVDLTGANLDRADLSKANLTFAVVRNASMRATNLAGAKLVASNLTGARMSHVRLTGATRCRTILADGTVDNNNCPQAATTSTSLPRTPLVVQRFTAPTGYTCDETRGKTQPATATATISWSVPGAGAAAFLIDGKVPAEQLGPSLPSVAPNPQGQPAGDVENGTASFAFVCDQKPHTIQVTWQGVELPGSPATSLPVTRSAVVTFAG